MDTPEAFGSLKPVVVVPVHKPIATELELISLRQLKRCLYRRAIAILAPDGLDLSFYSDLLPIENVLRVNPECMISIQAYNRFMISPAFFSLLSDFTHVLIHEPDAIVLRDELDFWCAAPFDYIGAPWFDGFSDATKESPPRGVGNFGFSLHNLRTAERVLRSNRRWYPQAAGEFIAESRGGRERLKRNCLGMFSYRGTLRGAYKLYEGNCDVFWCTIVPRVFPDFRIASIGVAMTFAWEVQPRRCFDLCGKVMPFGIHAWARYDLEFLLPKLHASGVDLTGLPTTH